MLIDFHSHILPGIDDGSKNSEQSVEMLQIMKHYGTDIVVATPHFYATVENPEAFFEKRKKSADKLLKSLPPDVPKILMGAEVNFYSGISHMDNLERFCIEGSKLLLLEMHHGKWSRTDVDEVLEIAYVRNIIPVIAHAERYLFNQEKNIRQIIRNSGIMIQSNSAFFTEFCTKRKALNLLKKGEIQFIGSDAHNTSYRAPDLDKAVDIIKKKLGSGILDSMMAFDCEQLNLKFEE